MRFALISDVHFGPLAYFQGKLRKLTHQAEALSAAFVDRMNTVGRPAVSWPNANNYGRSWRRAGRWSPYSMATWTGITWT